MMKRMAAALAASKSPNKSAVAKDLMALSDAINGNRKAEAYLTNKLAGGRTHKGNIPPLPMQGERLDFSGMIPLDKDFHGKDLSVLNFIDEDLRRAQLQNAKLNGRDLSGADLSGADLTGADLSGAKLNEATMKGANLTGADLTGAVLTNVNLSVAKLTEANLSGANLSGANLSGANLTGANLSGANLDEAFLIDKRHPAPTVRAEGHPEIELFIQENLSRNYGVHTLNDWSDLLTDAVYEASGAYHGSNLKERVKEELIKELLAGNFMRGIIDFSDILKRLQISDVMMA